MRQPQRDVSASALSRLQKFQVVWVPWDGGPVDFRTDSRSKITFAKPLNPQRILSLAKFSLKVKKRCSRDSVCRTCVDFQNMILELCRTQADFVDFPSMRKVHSMDLSSSVGAFGFSLTSQSCLVTPSVGPNFPVQNILVREMMEVSLGIGSCHPTVFLGGKKVNLAFIIRRNSGVCGVLVNTRVSELASCCGIGFAVDSWSHRKNRIEGHCKKETTRRTALSYTSGHRELSSVCFRELHVRGTVVVNTSQEGTEKAGQSSVLGHREDPGMIDAGIGSSEVCQQDT